jgi:hypothetical protein
MHEYRIQVTYTDELAKPWTVKVIRDGKQLYESHGIQLRRMVRPRR